MPKIGVQKFKKIGVQKMPKIGYQKEKLSLITN